MPLGSNLPLPPSRARLPLTRQSRLRGLLGRAGAKKRRKMPRLAPIPKYRPRTQPKQQLPGQRYKPPSEGKVFTTNPREILGLISRFAKERKVIIIRYRAKKHGGAVVTRAVHPYAMRYKATKAGKFRYFYAVDNGETNPTSGIHCFLVGNIVSVTGTQETYRPQWKVEF
jgi:hypothetical protein